MIETIELQQTQSAVNIGDLSSIDKPDLSLQSSNKLDANLPKYFPIKPYFIPASSDEDDTLASQAFLLARPDYFTAYQDVPLIGNVVVNDSLVSGSYTVSQFENSSFKLPHKGAVTLSDKGDLIYTPNADVTGFDFLLYTIQDSGQLSYGTVIIRINPKIIPGGVDDSFIVNEDAFLSGQVTVNDGVSSQVKSRLNSSVSNGSLTFNEQGIFTYIPNNNFNGNDSFTYINNNGIADSRIVTVNLTINPVNDSPIGIDDIYNVTGVINGNILSNDSDLDNNNLTVGHFDQTNSKGTLKINGNGTFTYTPLQGFNGIDTFKYKPYDGIENGNLTTITFNVTQPIVTPPITPDYYSSVDGYGLIDASKAVAASINQTPFAEVANTNTYNLDLIKAPESWANGYTGQGVIVAVLDTGFGLNFSGINYWKNVNEIANNGIDDDSNGYIDDYDGWNAYFNNGTITPSDHGSHVMGTVGDRAFGVAYGAQIMPVQVFDRDYGSWGAIEKGIYYAVVNGAKVINMSIGGGQVGFIKNAIGYAESKGVIVVSSAGNRGGNSPLYPAGFATEYGIAVGSVGNNKIMSSFSNKAGGDSKMIYVTAPGEDIVSYGSRSGTSMASPHVAGVVALMLSANPNLTPNQVKNILISNTYKATPTGLQLVENLVDDLV